MKTNQGPAIDIYSSKYTNIYKSLIEKRQKQVLKKSKELYTELHHILPRSLGGADECENLVRLTAREHFVAHCLLARMYKQGTNEYFKMHMAVSRMKGNHIKQSKRYINSRLYAVSVEIAHKRTGQINAVRQKGEGNSNYGNIWIYNPILKVTKRINKNDKIPSEWFKGRMPNLDKLDEEKQYMIEKEKKLDFLKAKLKTWYQLYDSLGWKKFVETTNYEYTQENLIYYFSVYVPEFTPQSSRIRGADKRASRVTLAKSKNV